MFYVFKKLTTLALLYCLSSGLYAEAQKQQIKAMAPHSEELTIYYGGDILTMEGDKPRYVQAVVQRDGKIIFVGNKAKAFKHYAKAANKIDLKGKTLLPGLIDAHGHFMSALQMVKQVNVGAPPVGTATDIPAVLKKLKDYQHGQKIPEGGWVVGWGYDPRELKENRHITKQDLDSVLPHHKVMIIHVSMHGAVLNSQALKWAGIDANTAKPAGGVIARVKGSNAPAGLLMEMAYLPVFKKLPQPSQEEMLAMMDPAQQLYASEGYTHASEGFTLIKDLRFLQKAAKEHKVYLDIDALPTYVEMDKWLGNPEFPLATYHNGLVLRGVKFIADGSPQGKTAYLTKPYRSGGPDGEKNWRGEPNMPAKPFNALIKKALDNHIQVLIHANGDAAIDQAIAAIDGAGIKAKDDRRTVIIHSQFQRPDQLPKYRKLGITPSYFTSHNFFWGDLHVRDIGTESAAFMSPLKSAKSLGIIASNHSDFNVTPLNPFFIMWTAMQRESRAGKIIGAGERVDAYTALQSLTTGPAYQLFDENRKGRIKEGLLADFVILDKNPLKTDVAKIKTIHVLETIKEGRTIYKRN